MIQKLIDYIQSKVSISITESNTTNSRYLKLANKTVRISDHFGHPKEGIDIVVIVPETPKTFVVSIGYKVYCYTSIRKVGDFIISYILIENNISDKYDQRVQNQTDAINKLQKQIQDLQNLNGKLQSLNKNLSNSSSREKELKEKVSNQSEVITILQNKQIELKEELRDKDAAIKEAVELIETLTTDPEARELLYSKHKGKTYFLDNFPDDAREMIEELIREYYSK